MHAHPAIAISIPQMNVQVNAVIWLTSPRANEVLDVEEMIDDAQAACAAAKLNFQHYEVKSAADLIDALDKIEAEAKNGYKPFLYLDMHGSATHGLQIVATNEFVTWPVLVEELRGINVATQNNLVVLAATCFGFHATKSVSITKESPFALLIAPLRTVTFAFLKSRVFDFFREMLVKNDVIAAYKNQLYPQMHLYHCEGVFTEGIRRYIQHHCKGKPARARREELLSLVLRAGHPAKKEDLKRIRKQIKDGIKPTRQMLNRFSDRFLIGRPLGYSFDQLMAAVDQNSRAQRPK
jgi:hypothetical protein